MPETIWLVAVEYAQCVPGSYARSTLLGAAPAVFPTAVAEEELARRSCSRRRPPSALSRPLVMLSSWRRRERARAGRRRAATRAPARARRGRAGPRARGCPSGTASTLLAIDQERKRDSGPKPVGVALEHDASALHDQQRARVGEPAATDGQEELRRPRSRARCGRAPATAFRPASSASATARRPAAAAVAQRRAARRPPRPSPSASGATRRCRSSHAARSVTSGHAASAAGGGSRGARLARFTAGSTSRATPIAAR